MQNNSGHAAEVSVLCISAAAGCLLPAFIHGLASSLQHIADKISAYQNEGKIYMDMEYAYIHILHTCMAAALWHYIWLALYIFYIFLGFYFAFVSISRIVPICSQVR